MGLINMKVKELIHLLKDYDMDLEVIIQRYDGIKSHNDFHHRGDIGLASNVMPSEYKNSLDKKPLARVLIIE